MFAPKTILVPTDFSEFSDNALAHAVDLAQQHGAGARIYLLHVLGIIQQCSIDYCLDAETVAEVERQSIESSLDLMKKQISKTEEGKGVAIIPEVVQGVAHQQILKEEKEKQVDLIVMGSHGKTGILNHFGSVADAVSRAAHCPVLIVKKG